MTKQSKLAAVEPTTREEVESVRELCSAIIFELQDIPHSTYRRAGQYLGELTSMFEEKLPGGFYGHCEGCNTILGNDDDFVSGEDVTICRDCAERYEAETAAANVSQLHAKETA